LSDLSRVFDKENLRRAYRWIQSNPDAQYKSYFRDDYDAFAIASDTHLKWLRLEGLRERYEVSHASKILVPKPSGTLRPITLLTVDDQIVYQACVNVIAEALKKKTGRRYETRVFAHLYAGKSSRFFYKKWQRSYQKFGQCIREAHRNGYVYVANFDLAAFYDSIDHHVLKHFLKVLNIDEDTVDFLLECLKKWTSTTWSTGPANIYHEHGIPQGPLSSGMLSEVVLMHLDDAGEQGSKTIYLRYVDDIKILARTEGELRRKLIKLDITAKEIGLFPQTSKINIRKIAHPDEEVKSVSRPPEPSLKPKVNQSEIVSRLLSISRKGKILPDDTTRFKYLLSHAAPNHRLNGRVMKLFRNHPDLAPVLCSYISKYNKIPARLAREIVNYIEGEELYHSVNGALLRASLNRMPAPESGTVTRFCSTRLNSPKLGAIPVQPSYKEALIAWALSTRALTFAEYENLLFAERDWWVKKAAIRQLTEGIFGPASYADIINRCMRATTGEIARIAASRLLQHAVKLAKPYGDVVPAAKRTLKAVGVIKSSGQPESRINEILSYIFNRNKTGYEWKKFYGKQHRHAELMMIFLKRNRESNIDAFLVQLDSYCDYKLSGVFSRLVPNKTCPKYGVALKHPVLIASLPNMMAAFRKLHDLRLQSTTAHPRSSALGKENRRLKHGDYKSLRPALIDAFDEFERIIIV
jgi:retron-type reverse transcriptase